MKDRARVSSILIATLLFMVVPAVGAAAATSEICVVNSDTQQSGAGFDRADLISVVDVDDFDPATNETTIGLTGTDWIEAIQFGSNGVLYAADEEQFGVIDLDTASFTATSQTYGTGDGALGSIRFHDIDGLAFAPDGTLYGSMRRTDEDPDLLIKINPATGAHVPDAFGSGVDYLVVQSPDADRTLWDVDDLAFIGDTLYAIVNLDGKRDRLATINTATGATTDIGATGQGDMEGLTTSLSGTHLWGVTGDANDAAIWHINPSTGAATQPRFLDNADDYEGITCRSMSIPESATVAVAPGACVFRNGASSTPVNVTIVPSGGATVTLRTGGGSVVETFTSTGSVSVPPGSYTWSAVAADGFTLAGPASGSFTALDCEPPVNGVGVAVVLGPCIPTEEGSLTDVSINVTVPGAATVVLTDADGATVLTTSDDATTTLPPGSYSWSATAATGFTLTGPASGGLTVVGCEEPPEDATVTVDAGSCVFREDLGRFRVPLSITIEPAGAATVTVERITGTTGVVGSLDGSGSLDVVGGNTYRWTAVPEPGFDIDGPASGELEIEECVLPAIAVSVTCVVGDAGNARARVGIPGGDAAVTLTSDEGFRDVFGSSTTSGVLPDGSYSWTAAADPGFKVTQPRSGSFSVDSEAKVCGLAITGSTVNMAGVGRIGWAALFIGAVMALVGRIRVRRPVPLPTVMGIPFFSSAWAVSPRANRDARPGRWFGALRRPGGPAR